MLAFLLAGTAIAQDARIYGVVKDSTGTGLEMANVIAYTQSNALAGYSITNTQGEYKIDVPADSMYTLKVTYIGLSAPDFKTPVVTDEIKHDFTMREDNALEEVNITYEMPVQIKGDTIIYNADSFNDGSERKLGDVIENLPGVEINDNGEIEVEGKTVTKVTVEGKEFFDGDSKLAQQNIPANAVDKVEVLRNFNEVKQLRGLNNADDQIAINIRLKEGKEQFWFGELMAGAGLDERYHVKPKVFYYSPKLSVNILTDLNNIGEEAFSRRDYFRFTGGLQSRTRGSGTSFNTSGGDLGFVSTVNNRARENESKFAAANLAYNPSDKLAITAYAIASDTETDVFQLSRREFIDTGVVENTENGAIQSSRLGAIKFGTNYTPNDDVFVEYDGFFRVSDQNEDSRLISQRQGITENIFENRQQQPLSVSQNLNTYITASEKDIFAGELNYTYSEEDPFYRAIRGIEPFNGALLLDDSQSNFDINQDKETITSRLNFKTDYYRVIGKKSNLNMTVGTILSRQDFDSGIFQRLDNGSTDNLTDPQLNNDVRFNFNDYYIGAHYKFVSGIFTVSPGLTYHHYDLTDTQNGVENDRDFNELLPDAFVRAQFGSSENLTLNYNRTVNFTDIDQLAEGFVFDNYNRLSRGNNQLENATYDNLSLAYFKFSMFNFTNIFGFVNYSKRSDPIKSQTVIDGINQVSEPINSRFADETLSASGSWDRRFKRWKAGLRANVSYNQFNNVVNGQQLESNSFTQTYRLTSGSNFKKGPNFDIGINYTITDYDQGVQDTQFTTIRPFANLNWKLFNALLVNVDFNYYDYQDRAGTVNNTYNFLDAELFYQKEDSKWEFKLGMTNLTDNESINTNNSGQFFITDNEYFVQPRYILFSVNYQI